VWFPQQNIAMLACLGNVDLFVYSATTTTTTTTTATTTTTTTYLLTYLLTLHIQMLTEETRTLFDYHPYYKYG